MGLLKELYNAAKNYKDKTKHGSFQPDAFTSSDPAATWAPILGLDLFDVPQSRYHYSSFAFACINKRALNLSKAKITLFKQFQKRNKEEDITHPFYRLLRSQNSLGQSFKEILYAASCNCDLKGWAFVLIKTLQTPLTVLGKNGKTPMEFIPLPARYVTPNYDSQNSMIVSYRYGNTTYSPDEILRFRVPNPDSNLLPNAPCSAFNFQPEIEYLMSRSRRVFFKNNALPSLAIEMPGKMNPDSKERSQKETEKNHSGVDNERRIIYADNGAKVTTLNNNSRELDFNTSRNQILQEIELILDVNDLVMGRFMEAGLNQKMALISWIENTLTPYAELVFNEPLCKFVYDYYDKKYITAMEFDASDPDYNLKIVDSQNIPITDNEKRRLLNWDDYSDPRADELYHAPVVPETQTQKQTT